MAHVVHAFTRFLDGGAERNTVHFGGVQQALGDDVRLLVGDNASTLAHPFEIDPLPALTRAPNPPRDVAAYRELNRYLQTRPVDVLHTHQAKVGLLGRAAARRARLARVHTFHGWSFGPQFGMAAPLFRSMERAAARWTDWFIAVGEELREIHLRAGIGDSDRMRVIRSPVDVDSLLRIRDASETQRREARERLAIRPRSAVIVVIGALEPRKRPIQLVHWLRDLLLERRDVVLVFRGAGPLTNEVQRLARSLGVGASVRVDGPGDVHDYLSAATLLALASESEGVPQVVLQALAAGVPVVATDVCGLREVADADIRVTSATGAGFAEAVLRKLESGLVRAVPPSSLDPWRAHRIEADIKRFRADLDPSDA